MMSLSSHGGPLKIFHYPCFVQETSVTSSWWTVLMLMSQQLAALILLALPAIITTPTPSSSFKAAATAAAWHAHFNTPGSFDRLYGLIILNIYRSHFPKPSMFIQHLGDHSMALFSNKPPQLHSHQQQIHTHTHIFIFSISSFLSTSLLSLSSPASFITTVCTSVFAAF